MNLSLEKIPIWSIIVIQIILFIFIILPLSLSLISAFFTIFFIIFEILVLSPIILKKKMRFFYILWQLQFFLVILFKILFDFQLTFQIADPQPTVIGFFSFSLIAVETLILLYIFFKERIVKKILFMLASSTTVIVFLIVFFVMSEGIPAFFENNPVDFITGQSWQPNYHNGLSETQLFTVKIEPYNFTVSVNKSRYYVLPYSSNNIVFSVSNTGGKQDEYYLSVESSINVSLEKKTIFLESQESNDINLTFYVENITNSNFTISVKSQNSSLEKQLTMDYIVSEHGVNLFPDSQFLFAESDAGGLTAPLKIINKGSSNDTFKISIVTSDFFRGQSIIDTGTAWDYNSNSTVFSMYAGESKNIKIFPSFIKKIDGSYPLSIKIQSENHPDVFDSSTLYFVYKKISFIEPLLKAESIDIDGTANFRLVINTDPFEKYLVKVNTSNNCDFILQYLNKSIILENIESGEFNSSENKFTELELLVSSKNADIGDVFYIEFIIQEEGLTSTYGILPFIVGTILTTILSVCIAAPLGLGTAILLAEFIPNKIRSFLRPLYELLAGIPSVIYGLWGALTFGPWISGSFYPFVADILGSIFPFFGRTNNMGKDVLTASIILSIMIIPIVITLSEDAIRSVSKGLKEGSLALGSTRWQTMKNVIIPKAKSGIITSIILGTGRAIGETMAVLMIMGLVARIPGSIFDPATTMTGVIANDFLTFNDFALTRHALFAIATILFIMVFCLNVIIFKIQKSEDISSKKKRLNFRKKIGHIYFFKKIKNINFKTKGKTKSKEFIILDFINKKGKKINQVDLSKPTYLMKHAKYTSSKVLINEKIIKILLSVGGIFVICFLFAIIGDIIVRGGLSLRLELFTDVEHLAGREGGFLNAIVGSLMLVGLAIGVATPLSIGAALYVQEYTKKSNIFTRIIMFTSDTLASTPSIVFGAFGFMFFVIYLQFSFSLLAGGLTLAIMVIPLMLRSSIEAIKSVPEDFREGAYALGATKWKAITSVVLPSALPGVISGVIISIGRAIGETAAVLLTAQYALEIPVSPLHRVASMPNLIWNYYNWVARDDIYQMKVYSAALILVLIVLLLNTIARIFASSSARMMKN